MKYYQLIPEEVLNVLDDVASIIEPDIKGFSIDNLKEVISIVACHSRDNNEPTPLIMTYLKKLVPQADKYMKGLIDLGIVERSGTPIRGEAAYKYRFSPEYYSKFVSEPLKNTNLIWRIERKWRELEEAGKKSARGRSEQIPYLKKLKIDNGYISVLNQYADDAGKYNAILGAATLIENGQIFVKVDNTSGRLHSNVTNLKSELRPHLRINGEPLVNIDLRNSQPYLSTILLNDPSKVSWMTTNPAFALLLQNLKVSHNQDVKDYISLVVSGELYEHLMDRFSEGGLQLCRDETKTQVLRILFARNRKPQDEINARARGIFIESFPTVHRIFSKVRGSNGGDKFHSYKRFAILLQKIEAYLMLDVILKRIYRELPGVIAITVHDSVMTGLLTNKVEAVREIIEDELLKFVGFRPRVKIEGSKEGLRDKEGGNSSVTNTVLQPLQDAV